jgi:glycine/D-amino acid oxidase-like deaminating enzyme
MKEMSTIDRRFFLGVAAAAALPEVARAANKAARPAGGSPDAVVVGAGAFGGWTALCLQERGIKTVSIDEYGPSNPRAASAGETRSIRSGYGEMGFYSGWAPQAMKIWQRRQLEFDRTLLYPNERIELANQWTKGLLAQRETFDGLGIAYEILDRQQLRARYPQMGFDDVEFAFVETKSAAVIKARESMIRASEVFQKKGGTFRIGRAMPGSANGRRLESVVLGDGSTVAAQQFIFSVGPWSYKVFPSEMKPRVRVSRSEYYYWGVPAGDDRFSWPNQPAWHDHIDGGYGFGSIERGLKYSPSGGGFVTHDPDTADRLPTAWIVEKGRIYIGKRFPAMRDAPIVETRVCQTENTVGEDFVIDRHPDYDNVWVASGGGGHGFKFGPIVGEYVADRVMGRKTDPALDQRFLLSTKAKV